MRSRQIVTFINHVTKDTYGVTIAAGGDWLTDGQIKRLETRVASPSVPLLAVITYAGNVMPDGWHVKMHADGQIWAGPEVQKEYQ